MSSTLDKATCLEKSWSHFVKYWRSGVGKVPRSASCSVDAMDWLGSVVWGDFLMCIGVCNVIMKFCYDDNVLWRGALCCGEVVAVT